MIKNLKKTSGGYALIQVIVFATISAYMLGALVSWAVVNIKSSKSTSNSEQALQIAEAGIDYYRWHLAHAPTDFLDGTATSGPYIHNFTDKSGNIIGTFSLDITAPSLGSTLVTIESTGKVNTDPNISRTIKVKLAKPSMAKYAVAANADMRFGAGTEIYGPIHSNGGILFDGIAHNIISSNKETYTDPDYHTNEYAVHTRVSPMDPTPPTTLPARPDIFIAGRQFPLPQVDFSGITADLALMKTAAIDNGFWRADSGKSGYHIILKTNNTFELRKVTKLINDCSNSWSIDNETTIGTYPMPTNGIIFLEDDVWVDGHTDGNRLTIIAAVLPDAVATRKNITINNDLLYTHYDGTDVIGLIAQNNINVGLQSEDDLKIDAALIAQKGRVGRYQYSSSCSATYYKRQTLTLYGMIGTYLRYGFAYVDGTGYQIRNLNYDANLLYAPPPSFPLTSDQYITLSWEEVK